MKLFTPEEANEALELVRPLVERLVEARREFVRLQAQLEQVRMKIAGNGGDLDPRALGETQVAVASALTEVDALIEEIQEHGAHAKDLDVGLVDFPALHPTSGAPVLLCWRLGEDEIGWWHGLEDGFAGRKPLPF